MCPLFIPLFIRVSFRLGKRRDEFSTCRASCDPEQSSWLISVNTHLRILLWINKLHCDLMSRLFHSLRSVIVRKWPKWCSWGAPDLVTALCPVWFFFLFWCHAPCGDPGPVSRFSVSGGPSAWWVRWETFYITINMTTLSEVAMYLYFWTPSRIGHLYVSQHSHRNLIHSLHSLSTLLALS